jgi:hypothetical protein
MILLQMYFFCQQRKLLVTVYSSNNEFSWFLLSRKVNVRLHCTNKKNSELQCSIHKLCSSRCFFLHTKTEREVNVGFSDYPCSTKLKIQTDTQLHSFNLQINIHYKPYSNDLREYLNTDFAQTKFCSLAGCLSCGNEFYMC